MLIVTVVDRVAEGLWLEAGHIRSDPWSALIDAGCLDADRSK